MYVTLMHYKEKIKLRRCVCIYVYIYRSGVRLLILVNEVASQRQTRPSLMQTFGLEAVCNRKGG